MSWLMDAIDVHQKHVPTRNSKKHILKICYKSIYRKLCKLNVTFTSLHYWKLSQAPHTWNSLNLHLVPSRWRVSCTSSHVHWSFMNHLPIRNVWFIYTPIVILIIDIIFLEVICSRCYMASGKYRLRLICTKSSGHTWINEHMPPLRTYTFKAANSKCIIIAENQCQTANG